MIHITLGEKKVLYGALKDSASSIDTIGFPIVGSFYKCSFNASFAILQDISAHSEPFWNKGLFRIESMW